MRLIIYALFLFCSFSLRAQTGNYFLSHYVPTGERFNTVCFAMAQDAQGILYFANKSGILQFDGRNWNQLNDNGAVYTLSSNSSGEIFWGGANGFGKISYKKNGFITSEKLSGTSDKDIFQSIIVGDKGYFLSDESLYIFSTASAKTLQINSTNLTGSFSGIFELYGKVYINTERGGLFSIQQSSLLKTKLNLPARSEIIFSHSFNNAYLVGTANSHIYSCTQNLQFKEIKLEDQTYVNNAVAISGSWINKKLVALGTLRGGVIFIDPSTGRTKEIVNYNTGLPDNEVFTMMSDRNQNIWIAHDYGFTRVAPYLPLYSFNHYEGLKGNLLCAATFKNQVYVGTSLGLFKLEKEDVYDEVISYEDVLKEVPKKNRTKAQTEKVETPEIKAPTVQPEVESQKKGFFKFLKKKKEQPVADVIAQDKKPDLDKPQETPAKVSFFKRKPVYVREKKIQRVLRSSQYFYRKVSGVNAKVTQLLEVHGKLITAGLDGAYEVNGLQSKSLLSEPVRFLYANDSILLASTYNDEIRSWLIGEADLRKSNLLENLDDEISFIFEGSQNEIWLCALDKIYKLEIFGTEVKNIQAFDLPNANLNESVGLHYDSKTIIVNAEGFYNYDRSKNKIIKLDTLPNPSVYFAVANSLWYRDTHGWNSLGETAMQSNLKLLNLFNDLRFISTDQSSDNLWLITDNNELFKFFGEKLRPYESGYPLLLKAIYNGEIKITSKNQIKIDEQQSSFSAHVVQPDYISAQFMEYRYYLKGLHATWSEWNSNNNVVDFPYLPPGKYKLQIQSKDIFGKVSDMEPLLFLVQPPYWQRPWFYALEFAVFAFLVVLSFRLSSKYVIVSRLLSLLTIILLIQFIQTVVSTFFSTKASPVMDFFIQVFVALLILPVEGYLRKLMVRTIDAKEIYKLIRNKKEAKPIEPEEEGW